MFLFILAFLLFSSLNFYSPRYLLCLLPLWYLIAAFLFFETLKNIPKCIPATIVIFIAGFQTWYTLNVRTTSDYDLGYTDVVKTQRDAIRWCADHQLQTKKIFAEHQLERAMGSEAAGFIRPNERFLHVSNQFDRATAFFIFTCNEQNASSAEAKQMELKTVVKFKTGTAWTEICTPLQSPDSTTTR